MELVLFWRVKDLLKAYFSYTFSDYFNFTFNIKMKFLSLLLVMVILLAILYQGIFTPAVKSHTDKKQSETTNQALKALNEAERLTREINKKNKDYQDKLNTRLE